LDAVREFVSTVLASSKTVEENEANLVDVVRLLASRFVRKAHDDCFLKMGIVNNRSHPKIILQVLNSLS
jgi:hypothetical protein